MGKTYRNLLIYWIVVIIVLAGCSPTASPTAPSTSPLTPPEVSQSPLTIPVVEPTVRTGTWPEGQVLYHADAEGQTLFYIYKVVNGAEPVKVSSSGNIELGARWSFDGQQIVFASYVDGMRTIEHIFTMAADGSGRTELPVDQPRLNWRPSLSPDGTQVVFISNRDSNFEIYKANLDGTLLVNLTNAPDSNERDPVWSPDGNVIVFVSDRSGDNGLYVMYGDGSNIRQLLDEKWVCSYPSWSPDGTKIAFTSLVDGGSENIYVVDADGNGAYQVVGRGMDDVMPTWVGDDRLLFSGGNSVSDTWDLYMVNIDGTGLVQLTDTPSYSERYPQWYP